MLPPALVGWRRYFLTFQNIYFQFLILISWIKSTEFIRLPVKSVKFNKHDEDDTSRESFNSNKFAENSLLLLINVTGAFNQRKNGRRALTPERNNLPDSQEQC